MESIDRKEKPAYERPQCETVVLQLQHVITTSPGGVQVGDAFSDNEEEDW